eukprot:CAMPEP_0174251348 /NCGR_PEP_ID=MMETSP0439-20130205/1198_1 /TAXON_ID=0 /ORGANISM="Stereomyxa ramosa, Strain Chinc5" /LENGTH=430 /DNA_ID=CAMNT_0015331633 /DNA_START=12 /DNA_END=1300 /DNA_ORIENTATION=-
MSEDTSSDDEEDAEEEKVEVRFVTKIKDKNLQVPDTPFFIPTRLTRLGLSEVVNHLLALETPRPFDFLIDDVFIRTSLEKFIAQTETETETILTIEYVETMAPPSHNNDFPQDDWVSCLAAGDYQYIITGSYDSKARVIGEKGETILTLSGHSSPIKSIAWLSSEKDKKLKFVSASKDNTLCSWKLSVGKDGEVTGKLQNKYLGHTGSVESVSVAPTFERFCSGSWDYTIKIWDPESSVNEEEEIPRFGSEESEKKKIKLDVEKQTEKGSINTLKGHNQCVSCTAWPYEETIYSGSWDHSIRQWDVGSAVNTRTLVGEKVVYCISYSVKKGVIVSGHNDRCVRLWDPRVSGGLVVKDKFISHATCVSGVAWHPTQETIFASCSFDSTIKLWDLRSKTPLYTMPSMHSQEKALCLGWKGDSQLVSGGSDCV